MINDAKISARHLELSEIDQVFWIEDLDSQNGVYLNGEKLYNSSRVNFGDKIQIGKETFS